MKLSQQAGNSSFVANSFFIFLVRFFPSLANILIIIVFSRYLAKADYGIYQNFWVRLSVLSTVACLGLQAFLVTYKPALVATFIRKLSARSVWFLVVWISMCAVIFATLQAEHFYWLLPFIFLVVYSLSTIIEAVLITFRSFNFLVIVNLLYTLLFCAVHWLFISQGWSIGLLFVSILVLTGLKLLTAYAAFTRSLKLQPHYSDTYDLQKTKNLWINLGVYDVSQVLFRWIDKFVISLLFAEELSAVYYNGAVEIPFLPLLLGAFASAALMQLSGLEDRDNDTPDVVSVVNRSGRLLSSIVFPLFFFFLVFREDLFLVLLGDKYLTSVPIFAMSILAMPLKTYSFTTILQNKHRGDVINKGAVYDLVLACILMYPLYLMLGLPGVALSFVVSTYLQAGYYLYHSSRELNISAFRLIPVCNWLIKLIVFAALFLAFYYLFAAKYSSGIVLALGGSFAVFVCAVSLYIELIIEKKDDLQA